jgi:hypothetical protein
VRSDLHKRAAARRSSLLIVIALIKFAEAAVANTVSCRPIENFMEHRATILARAAPRETLDDDFDRGVQAERGPKRQPAVF